MSLSRLMAVTAILATACASLTESSAAAPQRIEEAKFTTLGGIEQWTTLRGNDYRKPVLLVVHGGPGDILSPYL